MLPTLTQVAQQAGVSAATVDRVINARGGVRARTCAHVLAVARHMGYLAPEAGSVQAPPRPVRLAVLLPEGPNAFIQNLAVQVLLQAPLAENVSARVEFFTSFDPASMVARLTALRGAVDAVALVAIDHPMVREALRGLARDAIPVVTLASDIHNVPRLAYIGIDNGQAGRLAGFVLGRFLGRGHASKVALFAGSLAYRGHQERETGFRQILTEDFPGFDILDLREVHEDRDKAYRETIALLDRQPDLAAIYNAGGATAGIARALKERGRDQAMVFLAHEATEGNKTLLLDGTLDAVIDQNPRVEVREAISTLVSAVRGAVYLPSPPRIQMVFRENLPVE